MTTHHCAEFLQTEALSANQCACFTNYRFQIIRFSKKMVARVFIALLALVTQVAANCDCK